MKKTLLSVAIAAFSLGLSAQVVPSPFWTNQNANYSIPGVGSALMDVVDPNVVWAMNWDGIGGPSFNQFTRTINGGATYTSGLVFPNTLVYGAESIEGIDANTAWVTSYKLATTGNGAIHTTTNGGLTWTDMTPAFMFTNSASFVGFSSFFTPTVGITVGDPVAGEYEIYRTTDGGATWTALAGSVIPNPIGTEASISDVYTKFGTNDLWFGTNKGRVYHSNNQGVSWTVGSTGSIAQIVRLAFRDASNGIAITNVNTAYRTTNGGANWTQITPLDPNMGMWGLCAIPGTNIYASCGYVLGNQVISYSTNDGTTWTSWGGSNVEYLDIEFANNSVGFASGFSNSTTASIDGMFKYSGAPLGVTNVSGTPRATVEMYPNPSSGLVTIKLAPCKHGATLSVVDAMGKVVYSENLSNGGFELHRLNLEGFAKGIYSVNITRQNDVETNTIIIQ